MQEGSCKGLGAGLGLFIYPFAEPKLHARLLSRQVAGNMVTDLELIERNFAEGVGSIEMLCVYEVVDGRILRATFATGEKKLFARLPNAS